MHLMLAVALTIAYPWNGQTIARADVRECFEHLLAGAYYGHSDYESAAWVVLDHGQLECRDWPRTFAFRAESWEGQVPDGTVAIAHTHPAKMRRPSSGDLRVAGQLGVPVIVVTQGWVSIAATDGSIALYQRN